MLCLITYDLKSPGRDYSNLYKAIKSLGLWWHYLDSTWVVNGSCNPSVITNYLKQYLDSNDFLLVVEISGQLWDGCLPSEACEWLTGSRTQ